MEQLGTKYPELRDEKQDLQTSKQTREEDISKELTRSFNLARFEDFSGIEEDLKRDSPEECIESVNLLSKVIGNSRKKIIYYSALQGGLLKSVKETTTAGSFASLLALTQLSNSHAYFLVKSSDLMLQYPKLLHCELPLRFFRQNLNVVKQVCENEPDKWQ